MINRECYVFRIDALNGRQFGFTSLDIPLTIDGLVYEPIGGAESTATTQVTGLEIDNVRLELLLEDDLKLTPRYVYSGALTNARVKVGLVDFTALPDNLDGDAVIFEGSIATADVDDLSINLEVLNTTQKLNKSYEVAINSTCRFEFGGERCKYNLGLSEYTHNVNVTTVTKIPSGYNLALGNTPLLSNHVGGTLTFLSGGNQNLKYRIADIAQSTLSITDEVAEDIQIGDLVKVEPGCNKDEGSCRFYDNYENYGGGRQGGNHFRSISSIRI